MNTQAEDYYYFNTIYGDFNDSDRALFLFSRLVVLAET